ncbi:DUF3667 domain-containing protein [Qipengyuania sp. JC766]|uniref:DUF3667 domain-containing protein n=1 Tax=Qipengyuania sp. JC766 TaxID=3232139 RepID=UPI0034586049
MNDLPDALGTAAEGGLYARAVDGPAGSRPDGTGHFAEGNCLNCGTALVGSHCHACGQQAHLHRTIGAFLHDLLHGALHFEGRIWTTLPMLLRKPGELTRRYIEGERRRFVSPMALFLFSIFLMFAVFQAIGFTTPTTLNGPSREQIGSAIAEDIGEMEERLAGLDADLADPDTSAERRDRLTEQRTQMAAELDAARAATSNPFIQGMLDGSGNGNTGGGFTPTGDTGVGFLDKLNTKWRENPGLMLYKLQANSYKFSWLLIPLSIPFVWLLFAWKRRFRAYDHAVFVTYSLSFMSLLFVAVSILGTLGLASIWSFTILTTVGSAHLYKHLKHSYGLSRFSTVWRFLMLLFFILVIVLLFVQILVVLGAF